MVQSRTVGAAFLFLLTACATPRTSNAERSMHVSFLTRDGCANTAVMRERLDAALVAVGVDAAVVVIDVANLDANDALTGYGTPTILVGGVDLFGAPTPRPAPPT